MRNNVEGGGHTRNIFYCQCLIFLPFINHCIHDVDTRFSAIIGKVVLGLKLPSDKVGKLTGANITDLQECYCHDLPSPVSMSVEVRLWKKKWDSSEETKPCNLQ